VQVVFKKAFFKDLERLPPNIRSDVQQIVFVQLPTLNHLHNLPNVKKLTGYEHYYRLRIGAYRLGFKYEAGMITVYRVLHRKEIYKYFP